MQSQHQEPLPHPQLHHYNFALHRPHLPSRRNSESPSTTREVQSIPTTPLRHKRAFSFTRRNSKPSETSYHEIEEAPQKQDEVHHPHHFELPHPHIHLAEVATTLATMVAFVFAPTAYMYSSPTTPPYYQQDTEVEMKECNKSIVRVDSVTVEEEEEEEDFGGAPLCRERDIERWGRRATV